MIVNEQLLQQAPGFAVVLARVGGLFMLTPLLSSSVFPMRIKALVTFALAAAIFPLVGAEAFAGQRYDIVMLLPLLASEVLVGLILGILASVPLYSVQLGGLLMGQQMGLGLAQVVNPASEIEGDNLGQLLFIVAIATFVMLGGLDLLLAGVIESFARVPAGGFGAGEMPVGALVGLIHSGFEMAVRIALPVIGIIFVENLIVGYLMKTVPSMNIMNFGFPIKIMLGLVVVLAAIGAIGVAIGEEVLRALDVAEAWVMSLGEDGGGGG